ncbi:hypothetical protein HYH02_009885 [Chlamydomonas schloesseri]|uniref:Phosphodiesterase n=1 Tax=Chlamydomonas schloesseri TaxID=2026947 RepID=A0A835T9B7_9CHLO|nr:hypothetical protein HYH02_009885 [Chlamydomonas schloesseri]|eukprot:KAG2441292.1 hypothetical protein HYH02_009885 [Chlamydomonas schloesseri]
MAAVVHHDPAFAEVAALFAMAAPELAALAPPNALHSLQLAPQGVIRLVYPDDTADNNTAVLGYDLFAGAEQRGAVATVALRQLTLMGPLTFLQGGYGLRARLPVFIRNVTAANETWGAPDPAPGDRCGAPCAYNATAGTKWWGFATALIELDRLHTAAGSRLAAIHEAGYHFELLAPAYDVAVLLAAAAEAAKAENSSTTATDSSGRGRDSSSSSSSSGSSAAALNLTRVTGSDTRPSDPVEAVVELPGMQWYLRVAPAEGWTPGWFAPVLAVVVVVDVAFAVMTFAVLVSRRQHQRLLEALLPRDMIDNLRKDDAMRLGPRMLDAATTADMLLDMLSTLLEGGSPDLRDLLFIREQILGNMDIYAPLHLGNQLRDANLDDDVAKMLMHQLGGKFDYSFSADDEELLEGGLLEDLEGLPGGGAGEDGDGDAKGTGRAMVKSITMTHHDYATLSGALAMILAPQTGWYDAGPDLDAASDAALPTAQTEAATHDAAPSLRPSITSTTAAATAAAAALNRAVSHMCRQASGIHGEPGAGPGSDGDHGGGGVAGSGGSRSVIAQRLHNGVMNGLSPRMGAALDSASLTAGALTAGAGSGPLGRAGDGSGGDGGSAGRPRSSSAGTAAGGGGGGGGGGLPGSTAQDPFLDAALTTASAITFAVGSPQPSGGGGGGGDDRSDTGPRPRPLHRQETQEPSTSGPTLGGVGAATRARRRSALVTIADGGGGAMLLAPATSGRIAGSAAADAAGEHPAGLPGGVVDRQRLWASSVSRRSITGTGLVLGSMLLANAKKAIPAMPAPPAPIIDDVEKVLAGADGWQFDTWRLREVTNGHPLSALGFFLIQRAGLITRLKLKPAVLARLLRHIEGGYVDNPYHSATHAADVLQTLHVIIHGAQLHVHYLDPLGLFAAYWAAIVHDYGHPGLTNDFLINTSDPLAVRYNDRSPLENHHAAASFSALRRPGLDVLAPLSAEQKSAFRKQVIDMVLATDMKQHFSLLSHFNTVHRLTNYTKPVTSTPGGTTPFNRMLSNPAEMAVVSIETPASPDAAARPIDDTERLLSLQIAIKAADIGHLGESAEVHKRWLAGLEEEFFRQGDKEKALGIPISPLFDRAKQGVSKSQVGFYDFVALPLVHALAGAFPGTQPLYRCFNLNYGMYTRAAEATTASGSEPRPSKLGAASPTAGASSRVVPANTPA